jgi:hypothetical protein
MEYRMTAMGKPKSAEETMEREAVFITAPDAGGARSKFLARFPDAVGLSLHFWCGESNGCSYANGIRHHTSKRPGAKRSMGEAYWCLAESRAPWSQLEWQKEDGR